MEVRDLQYFVVIAQHGNLGRASEALGLSPPALSKSLRRLEASVDAKLVQRTPKGVMLTSSGEVLLRGIAKLRCVLDDVKREAADLGRGKAGHLAVGVGQADTEIVTIPCASLLDGAPKLTIEVVVSNNDVMVPRLFAGTLDLIVNFLPEVPFDGTTHEHLFDDEVAAYVAPGHPLAARRQLTIADVANERWALGFSDNIIWQHAQQKFAENRLPPPNVALTSRSVHVRLFGVAHSALVGIFSRRMVRQMAAARVRLVRLPVKGLAWKSPIGVIYRKDGYLPPQARRLIELLRADVAVKTRANGGFC